MNKPDFQNYRKVEAFQHAEILYLKQVIVEKDRKIRELKQELKECLRLHSIESDGGPWYQNYNKTQ